MKIRKTASLIASEAVINALLSSENLSIPENLYDVEEN